MGKMGDSKLRLAPHDKARQATGYVRVSTAEQAREGVSLEAQRARISAHCAAHGWTLGAVHCDEGISGRKASNRPGLEAALHEVCDARGVLVVYSLSRLARSTKDAILIAERLSKSKAELVLLSESVDTTTASGRMFYAVLAALAAFESDLIGERTKLALDHRRAEGKRYCRNAPYGFAFNERGALVPHSEEQRAISAIRELSTQGSSLRSIAARLPEIGLLNRADRPFSAAQVGVLLRRPH